jgi:Outer membrane protein beta-barrel family/Carboxypeptidase regulatory-like domain
MKYVYFLLFCVGTALQVAGQKNGSVKGRLVDTLAKQPLAYATVTVLKKSDSALVNFTMTDKDGKFYLSRLPQGDFRLLITHINYHNSNIYFSLTDTSQEKDLGDWAMNDKTKVLSEIVVNAEAPPVTMNNDSLEYNAASFKTRPNAVVEDLLKKLPGVQVEKDGTVKAQGQKVNRITVDGKEFFGNDPKIATRNLPADAVDKVQVYDRMSDMSQLTGFDDGNSEKAINLKLKKDKKKGVFGKITAGAGTEDRYEGRFNVNSFKGARQFSAIGMGNNTNAEGFSFMDILNFSGALNQMRQQGGGNININMDENDPNAALFGLGGANRNNAINTTWGTGLNYNNIIGTKTDFQSNYFYSRFNPATESNIQRQYFLPDSSYFYQQQQVGNNLNNNHRFNFTADYRIDSFHSLKITPSVSFQNTRNRSNRNYKTLSDDGGLTNEGYSNNNSNSKGFNFQNSILFRKKFHKKGRTFSVSLQNTVMQNTGDAALESVNRFYSGNGALLRADSIDQQNNTGNEVNSYQLRLAYTEPIFRKTLLELNGTRSNSNGVSNKQTFDFNRVSRKFDRLNERLSNDFKNTYGFSNVGIRFRIQQKKYQMAWGINWQEASLRGKVVNTGKDSLIAKKFYNVLPNARFQYNFTKFKNIQLSYNTNTSQPTIQQLQPVPDISNPLAIRLGNPDLKQEYQHNINLNVFLLSPYKNKNFFLNARFRQTQNKIVDADSINNFGIKQSRPVNTNGVYNINGDLNYSFPMRFIKGTLELGTSLLYNKNKQFINSSVNNISNLMVGPNVRMNMNLGNKIDASLNAGIDYTKTNYTLPSAPDAEYLSYRYEAEVNWQLPKNFFLGTDFNYTVNTQRAAGFNARVPIWNASFSKQFLKYSRGELKIQAYDLLNKNIGINRSSNQNYIEDSRVTILRRFFLLSFTYSLTRNGLNAGGGGNNSIKVISR